MTTFGWLVDHPEFEVGDEPAGRQVGRCHESRARRAQTAGVVQAAEDVRFSVQEALHVAAHLGVVRCDERAHTLKHSPARRREPREVTLAAQRADRLSKPVPDEVRRSRAGQRSVSGSRTQSGA